MTQDFRVGCIGAGYFSQFHLDGWRRCDGADPVAVVDRDLTRAASSGLAAYDDAAQMLAELRPDIVDIVTPPATHLDLIRLALVSGARAVICQKPFCLSVDEAEQAARLSEQAAVPLIVHENFRFQPWYRCLKATMATGTIGEVLQLTFRLRPGDGQGADAYLDRQPYFRAMKRFMVHETAVHWIDTFRYLLGEPEAVFADLRQLNPSISGEDAGHILFRFPGGARALFDGNRLLDHAADNLRCTMGEALVEGTAGTLTLTGDGSVWLRRFGETATRQVLAPDHSGVFGGDCVYRLQSHVVQALRSGTTPENTARAYLPVLRAEAAIYQSASIGGWVRL